MGSFKLFFGDVEEVRCGSGSQVWFRFSGPGDERRGRCSAVAVKSQLPRCGPSVRAEVPSGPGSRIELAAVGTTAGFCSVKRFVYAALLLCTSDNCCQQLLQTWTVLGGTFGKVGRGDRLRASNRLLRRSSSSRSVDPEKTACVVDLFSFARLCCAFLCPLARAQPPS